MTSRTDKPASAAERTRVVMGRYRLDERLGIGGSAEVWRARDEQLSRLVAVKLLHPHLLPDEASRRRFEAEARAASGLSHPGIVSVYDLEATPHGSAIVFELVEGESLAARLARDGALPDREAAAVAAQVADALYHAHQRGVIHRDVKPGNILLTTDGRARLVDFGIARSLQEGNANLTATGTIMGTLRYMAPEQLMGEPVTPRTDVYAVGAVLYEMLTGRPPFPAQNPLALAEAQRGSPDPIAGVSPQLARIALTALEHDVARRHRTAGVMAELLRTWLSGGEHALAAAWPVSADVSRTDATTSAVVAPAAMQPPVRRRRGPLATAVLVTSATVLGLVLLAAAIGSGGRPDSAGDAAGNGAPTASPVQAPAAAPPEAAPAVQEDPGAANEEASDNARGEEHGRDRGEKPEKREKPDKDEDGEEGD